MVAVQDARVGLRNEGPDPVLTVFDRLDLVCHVAEQDELVWDDAASRVSAPQWIWEWQRAVLRGAVSRRGLVREIGEGPLVFRKRVGKPGVEEEAKAS